MKPNQAFRWLLTVLLGAAFVLSGCGDSGEKTLFDPYQINPNENLESGNLFVKEAEMSSQLIDEGLSIVIPIHQKTAAEVKVDLTVTLTDLAGESLSESTVALTLKDALQDSEVVLSDLPEGFADSDKGGFLMKFRLDWTDGKIWGTRSLHTTYRYVQAQLMGSENLYEGGTSFYKLIVHEPNSGQPVEGASANFVLVQDDDESPVGSGVTDAFGMTDVRIDLPSQGFGNAQLKVLIDMPDGKQQEQALTPLSIAREAKVLLTTDKPLYQPGQTIHLRALALKRPDLKPQAGMPVTFFVIDPKGNKVFKQELESSDYGVAATEFKLATILNEGVYTLQAQVGEFAAEKSVTVERYALPKFNVELSTDRSFYRPGQTLHGSVNSDYFFGKPVDGGAVTITASKFDVEMETFATLNGTLNEEGEFDFDLELPSYFVAAALDENKAYVFLEIAVTDTAGHQQIKSTSALVVENPILLAVVPETGSLVPGIENRFYLMTTDPFGRPLDAACALTIDGNESNIDTGLWGLAIFEFTPQSESLDIAVAAQTGSGDTASKTFSFASETQREYVMLRTDKALYKVGETVEIGLFATNDGWDAVDLPDRIYLDVIKDGQTMLMHTVSLVEGKGSYAIDLDATLSGSVELMAYYLGAAGEIIRDRKLIFVELANSLTVEIIPDKSTYLPAEDATISLRVKDNEQNGVQSVLGVQVVDEAVFALQDMKPGMEKIYFELEEELLAPRYEIHGFDAADILEPEPENSDEAEEREAYAGAFLASAGTDAAYGVNVDTFANVDSTAQATATTRVSEDLQAVIDHLNWLYDSGFITGEQGIKAWIEQRNSGSNPLYDPWGHAYTMEYGEYRLTLRSNGMDERKGSADDLEVSKDFYAKGDGRDEWDGEGGFDDDALDGEPNAPGEGIGDGDMADGDAPDGDAQPSSDDGEEEDGPRVRSYFPETLYVNPAVITDASGEAEINFTMADSITSWRMTALASSLAGQIGSNVGNVIVYQDFFVDIDFPATLTQNDIVAVPIAIYNYLQSPQTINLEAAAGDWIEFLEGQTRSITVGPSSVTGIYFPVKVVKVGWHDFTVTAIGSEMSDAIRRRVEVIPDGLEVRNAESGRLDGSKSITVNIPELAVDDASRMWVKIYPGLFSQMIEGLDSLLQMPSGCFEQTSSATYPNVLVLDYMALTGQSTPEIELKARDYVSQGYQRLVSYEVDGGGFEWFGETPAHRILTAYGLLEFSDMSKVHDVDEAIITRTQNWLAALQNGDGSYDFDAGGIHEGATNNFTSSKLRTTAYITYALAESGFSGGAVSAGVNWAVQNRSEAAGDNYTLALLAMMLTAADPDNSALDSVLDDLYEARVEDEDGKIYWTQEEQTEMYGSGGSAEMETTGLVGQAFIRAGQNTNLVPGIMDWLLSKKDSFGNWSTTAGTIQALRFMIASLGSQVEESNATIIVNANGSLGGTVTVDANNSEVMQYVDLSEFLVEGDNAVELVVSGEGNLMYSVVSSYWVPGEENPYGSGGPLTIDISYDKTTLAVDDIVTATAAIGNVSDANVLMVLVDIGLPPGFDLVPDDLVEQVQNTALQRYEVAGRQLILYVERIAAGETLSLTYQLRARFPMEGSSGSASAAPYYEPESESTTAPVAFNVTE